MSIDYLPNLSQAGRLHVLAIGINEHEWQAELRTAEKGVEEFCEILVEKYGVDSGNINKDVVGQRATVDGIHRALRQYVGDETPIISEEDSLIIFFSGHGYWDNATETGYIVPYDASEDSIGKCISYDLIRRYCNAIKARHILLICDSCFSGGALRSLPHSSSASDAYAEKAYKLASRHAITSGGVEVVEDSGRDGHSTFSYYLIKALRENESPTLLIRDLFNSIRDKVAGNAEAKPEHGKLHGAGDEGGELVLFNSNAAVHTKEADFEDFEDLIDDRARHFFGRQFIMDEVDRFTNENESGYFILTADAGFGKTSFAAHLAHTKQLPRHFINGSMENGTGTAIKKNLFAQVLKLVDIKSNDLSEIREKDDPFYELLKYASEKRGQKTILIVDGIDERHESETNRSKAFYFFSSKLPNNIYIFVTSRRDGEMHVPVDSKELHVQHDSADNIDDVMAFIKSVTVTDAGIREFIERNNISADDLSAELARRSEYNFMYLTHVLPHISGSEDYSYSNLDDLPQGLKQYYEDHWRRMKVIYGDEWYRVKLPILVALTLTNLPVSIDQLMWESGIDDRHQVRQLLKEWAGLIHRIPASSSKFNKEQFRLYHETFRSFVYDRDEVEDERIELTAKRRTLGQRRFQLLMNQYGVQDG